MILVFTLNDFCGNLNIRFAIIGTIDIYVICFRQSVQSTILMVEINLMHK